MGKKIGGRFHYFGKLSDDPEDEEAEELYNHEKEFLEAGREPPPLEEERTDGASLNHRFVRSLPDRKR